MTTYAQQQSSSYGHLSSSTATANSIAAARYGAYTSSYQRPYIPGAQPPYLSQQGGYGQLYSAYHQQPQIALNQAPAKQEDDPAPDGETSSAVLRRFVCGQLQDAGFTGSEKQALTMFEKEVIAGKSPFALVAEDIYAKLIG